MEQPKFNLIFGSGAVQGEMLVNWPELEYIRGWGFLDPGDAPAMEYFNRLQNLSDLKAQYLFSAIGIRESNQSYVSGQVVASPNLPVNMVLFCSTGGETASNEPDFSDAALGSTYKDGSATWEVIPRYNKITLASEQDIRDMVKEAFK